MKNMIFISLLLYICACNDSAEKRSSLTTVKGIEIDALRKKYILDYVRDKGKTGKNAYFFIFPSFCGACTDSIMNLIRSNPLKTFYPFYVYRDVDSANELTEIFQNGKTKFMNTYELGRHGMEAAHNQLYLFEDTICIYHAKLSAETVPQVRKELATIASNAQ